ncbi:hypothetical protein CHGG_09011 [Chaetomium globosum CBS 148.51]|uniref:Uncharacterized protein n=1 Tax=Chaetomium globosum (strain ATCC 6205 / CBS 148.51 / DSM 1962 / NBRC 6347 / NRRL 1970) TaxID=306901 RepID=Q2GSP3_CHAGB|nr:uncharacterized protein CHGG_09011 [Chaetomium globosum CBS 148.51]EAQ84997.1 hypothetical protein CHGG_09011 [Chaetomium globosum CBS 148.51]
MSGEGVFRELGRSLARARHGKLLHTSYTANGVRPVHENLINRASCIIIVTADANRNLYQAGFTKHVSMMCSMLRASGQKKSLIVVAVSSPYDFAMDKSVSAYICTFDFTEMAMGRPGTSLVRQVQTPGDAAGHLEKERRGHTPLSYSTPTSRKLTSWCATAAPKPSTAFARPTSSRHGIMGALFVDSAKRNVSIGRSFQRRALRGLSQKPGIKKMQLGMSFPGVFLGIPADDSAGLKQWFANGGWDLQFPRRLANMTIPSLSNWGAPEGLLQNIQRAGISFDLIHGPDNADSVLGHIVAHANAEVMELYRFALQESKSCGVVRAKGHGESLLGTVIICSPGSPLAGFIPPLQPSSVEDDEPTGGIVAPLVASSAPQASLVLQGLALMGLRQNKAHKALRSVLSWVQDEAHEPLLAMGFEVVQAFEEFTNPPDNWQDIA